MRLRCGGGRALAARTESATTVAYGNRISILRPVPPEKVCTPEKVTRLPIRVRLMVEAPLRSVAVVERRDGLPRRDAGMASLRALRSPW